MRLGLSYAVDLIWIPLSSTSSSVFVWGPVLDRVDTASDVGDG